MNMKVLLKIFENNTSKEVDKAIDDLSKHNENIENDKQHQNEKSTNKTSDEFSCDECDYTSQGKRSLKKHMKNVHMLKHKCDECNFNATSEHYLKLHVQSHHKDAEIKNPKKRKNSTDDLRSRKKSK